MNKTLQYYAENAKDFVASTVEVDVSLLRDRFLKRLPAKARILDAGCGSGRDALAFAQRGHIVSAFDAVPEMVHLARDLTGLPIEVATFQTLSTHNAFDGIWACASLLHVPLADLDDVFTRLSKALVEDGILYASFKLGEGEVDRNGRVFTCFCEESFRGFIAKHGSFVFLDCWISTDARPGREDEYWLNALLKKMAH